MFHLVYGAFSCVVDKGSARFSNFTRVEGARFVVARRSVDGSTIRVDIDGVEVRFGDLVVVYGDQPVVLRRNERVNAVVVYVGGVQDGVGRLVRVFSCRLVVCHDCLFAYVVAEGVYVNDLFDLLVFRLLTASGHARGVYERRVAIRRSYLYRVKGYA